MVFAGTSMPRLTCLPIYQQTMSPGLGLSGILMGLVAADTIANPDMTLLLFFVVPVPAITALFGLVAIDVAGVLGFSGQFL